MNMLFYSLNIFFVGFMISEISRGTVRIRLIFPTSNSIYRVTL